MAQQGLPCDVLPGEWGGPSAPSRALAPQGAEISTDPALTPAPHLAGVQSVLGSELCSKDLAVISSSLCIIIKMKSAW